MLSNKNKKNYFNFIQEFISKRPMYEEKSVYAYECSYFQPYVTIFHIMLEMFDFFSEEEEINEV